MKKTVFIAALCMLTLAAPARANVPEQKKPWLPALDKIYLKKSGYTVTEKPRPDRSYLLPDAVDYRVGQDYALPFTPHAGKPLRFVAAGPGKRGPS